MELLYPLGVIIACTSLSVFYALISDQGNEAESYVILHTFVYNKW